MISGRTSVALQAAKPRGKKLGNAKIATAKARGTHSCKETPPLTDIKAAPGACTVNDNCF